MSSIVFSLLPRRGLPSARIFLQLNLHSLPHACSPSGSRHPYSHPSSCLILQNVLQRAKWQWCIFLQIMCHMRKMVLRLINSWAASVQCVTFRSYLAAESSLVNNVYLLENGYLAIAGIVDIIFFIYPEIDVDFWSVRCGPLTVINLNNASAIWYFYVLSCWHPCVMHFHIIIQELKKKTKDIWEQNFNLAKSTFFFHRNSHQPMKSFMYKTNKSFILNKTGSKIMNTTVEIWFLTLWRK